MDVSLIGRGVNVANQKALAEKVNLAGVLREVIALGQTADGLGALERAVFEQTQLDFHRGGQRVAEHAKSNLAQRGWLELNIFHGKVCQVGVSVRHPIADRKSTRLNS